MKYLAIFLLLALIFPTVIFGTADGPDYWAVHGVRSSDVLNVREKSTWKSKKIGEIPYNGKCIQNLGCIGGLTMHENTELSEAEQKKIQKNRPRWCKIKYKNIEGWVSGKYLREDQECHK